MNKRTLALALALVMLFSALPAAALSDSDITPSTASNGDLDLQAVLAQSAVGTPGVGTTVTLPAAVEANREYINNETVYYHVKLSGDNSKLPPAAWLYFGTDAVGWDYTKPLPLKMTEEWSLPNGAGWRQIRDHGIYAAAYRPAAEPHCYLLTDQTNAIMLTVDSINRISSMRWWDQVGTAAAEALYNSPETASALEYDEVWDSTANGWIIDWNIDDIKASAAQKASIEAMFRAIAVHNEFEANIASLDGAGYVQNTCSVTINAAWDIPLSGADGFQYYPVTSDLQYVMPAHGSLVLHGTSIAASGRNVRVSAMLLPYNELPEMSSALQYGNGVFAAKDSEAYRFAYLAGNEAPIYALDEQSLAILSIEYSGNHVTGVKYSYAGSAATPLEYNGDTWTIGSEPVSEDVKTALQAIYTAVGLEYGLTVSNEIFELDILRRQPGAIAVSDTRQIYTPGPGSPGGELGLELEFPSNGRLAVVTTPLEPVTLPEPQPVGREYVPNESLYYYVKMPAASAVSAMPGMLMLESEQQLRSGGSSITAQRIPQMLPAALRNDASITESFSPLSSAPAFSIAKNAQYFAVKDDTNAIVIQIDGIGRIIRLNYGAAADIGAGLAMSNGRALTYGAGYDSAINGYKTDWKLDDSFATAAEKSSIEALTSAIGLELVEEESYDFSIMRVAADQTLVENIPVSGQIVQSTNGKWYQHVALPGSMASGESLLFSGGYIICPMGDVELTAKLLPLDALPSNMNAAMQLGDSGVYAAKRDAQTYVLAQSASADISAETPKLFITVDTNDTVTGLYFGSDTTPSYEMTIENSQVKVGGTYLTPESDDNAKLNAIYAAAELEVLEFGADDQLYEIELLAKQANAVSEMKQLGGGGTPFGEFGEGEEYLLTAIKAIQGSGGTVTLDRNVTIKTMLNIPQGVTVVVPAGIRLVNNSRIDISGMLELQANAFMELTNGAALAGAGTLKNAGDLVVHLGGAVSESITYTPMGNGRVTLHTEPSATEPPRVFNGDVKIFIAVTSEEELKDSLSDTHPALVAYAEKSNVEIVVFLNDSVTIDDAALTIPEKITLVFGQEGSRPGDTVPARELTINGQTLTNNGSIILYNGAILTVRGSGGKLINNDFIRVDAGATLEIKDDGATCEIGSRGWLLNNGGTVIGYTGQQQYATHPARNKEELLELLNRPASELFNITIVDNAAIVLNESDNVSCIDRLLYISEGAGLTLNADIAMNAHVDVYGTLTVNSGKTLTIGQEITVFGTLTAPGNIVINNSRTEQPQYGARLHVMAANIYDNNHNSRTVFGIVDSSGHITNNGLINCYEGGTLKIRGTYALDPGAENEGKQSVFFTGDFNKLVISDTAYDQHVEHTKVVRSAAELTSFITAAAGRPNRTYAVELGNENGDKITITQNTTLPANMNLRMTSFGNMAQDIEIAAGKTLTLNTPDGMFMAESNYPHKLTINGTLSVPNGILGFRHANVMLNGTLRFKEGSFAEAGAIKFGSGAQLIGERLIDGNDALFMVKAPVSLLSDSSFWDDYCPYGKDDIAKRMSLNIEDTISNEAFTQSDLENALTRMGQAVDGTNGRFQRAQLGLYKSLTLDGGGTVTIPENCGLFLQSVNLPEAGGSCSLTVASGTTLENFGDIIISDVNADISGTVENHGYFGMRFSDVTINSGGKLHQLGDNAIHFFSDGNMGGSDNALTVNDGGEIALAGMNAALLAEGNAAAVIFENNSTLTAGDADNDYYTRIEARNGAEIRANEGANVTLSPECHLVADNGRFIGAAFEGLVDNFVQIMYLDDLTEYIKMANRPENVNKDYSAKLIGDVAISENLTFPKNASLYIPTGRTLTINATTVTLNSWMTVEGTLLLNSGKTLHVNGDISVANSGVFTANGNVNIAAVHERNPSQRANIIVRRSGTFEANATCALVNNGLLLCEKGGMLKLTPKAYTHGQNAELALRYDVENQPQHTISAACQKYMTQYWDVKTVGDLQALAAKASVANSGWFVATLDNDGGVFEVTENVTLPANVRLELPWEAQHLIIRDGAALTINTPDGLWWPNDSKYALTVEHGATLAVAGGPVSFDGGTIVINGKLYYKGESHAKAGCITIGANAALECYDTEIREDEHGEPEEVQSPLTIEIPCDGDIADLVTSKIAPAISKTNVDLLIKVDADSDPAYHTAAGLQDVLDAANSVKGSFNYTVVILSCDITVGSGESITVYEGLSLNLHNGAELRFEAGATLNNNGSMSLFEGAYLYIDPSANCCLGPKAWLHVEDGKVHGYPDFEYSIAECYVNTSADLCDALDATDNRHMRIIVNANMNMAGVQRTLYEGSMLIVTGGKTLTFNTNATLTVQGGAMVCSEGTLTFAKDSTLKLEEGAGIAAQTGGKLNVLGAATVHEHAQIFCVSEGASISSITWPAIALRRIAYSFEQVAQPAVLTAALNTALNPNAEHTFIEIGGDVTLAANAAVPENTTLYIKDGSVLTIPAGKTLTNNSRIEVGDNAAGGDIPPAAQLRVLGKLINNSEILVNAYDRLVVMELGEIENNGIIYRHDTAVVNGAEACIDLGEAVSFTALNDMFHTASYDLEHMYAISTYIDLVPYGEGIVIPANVRLTWGDDSENRAGVMLYGTIDNYGEFIIDNCGFTIDGGTITNNSFFCLQGEEGAIRLTETMDLPKSEVVNNAAFHLYDSDVVIGAGARYTVGENAQTLIAGPTASFTLESGSYFVAENTKNTVVVIEGTLRDNGMDKMFFGWATGEYTTTIINEGGTIEGFNWYTGPLQEVIPITTPQELAAFLLPEPESDAPKRVGRITGNVTMAANATLHENAALEVAEGAVLTIPSGKELTAKGNIDVFGTMNVAGRVSATYIDPDDPDHRVQPYWPVYYIGETGIMTVTGVMEITNRLINKGVFTLKGALNHSSSYCIESHYGATTIVPDKFSYTVIEKRIVSAGQGQDEIEEYFRQAAQYKTRSTFFVAIETGANIRLARDLTIPMRDGSTIVPEIVLAIQGGAELIVPDGCTLNNQSQLRLEDGSRLVIESGGTLRNNRVIYIEGDQCITNHGQVVSKGLVYINEESNAPDGMLSMIATQSRMELFSSSYAVYDTHGDFQTYIRIERTDYVPSDPDDLGSMYIQRREFIDDPLAAAQDHVYAPTAGSFHIMPDGVFGSGKLMTVGESKLGVVVPGDLSGDGKWSLADIVLLKQRNSLPYPQYWAADYNGDNIFGADDDAQWRDTILGNMLSHSPGIWTDDTAQAVVEITGMNAGRVYKGQTAELAFTMKQGGQQGTPAAMLMHYSYDNAMLAFDESCIPAGQWFTHDPDAGSIYIYYEGGFENLSAPILMESLRFTALEETSDTYVHLDVISVEDAQGNQLPYFSDTPAVVEISRSQLLGKVTVTGAPIFGTELSATLSGQQKDAGDITWQWYRQPADGSTAPAPIADATHATYLLRPADIGSVIIAGASAQHYSGEVFSGALTVQKLNPGKSNAPTLEASTADSITLTPPDNLTGSPAVEYACIEKGGALDDDDWQNSHIFTGLKQKTTYLLYARYKETATTTAGEQSAALTVTTAANPVLTPQAANGTIQYKYQAENDTMWRTLVSALSFVPGSELNLRAVPAYGFMFNGWTIDVIDRGGDAENVTCNWTVNGNAIVKAAFTAKITPALLYASGAFEYDGTPKKLTDPIVRAADVNGDIDRATIPVSYNIQKELGGVWTNLASGVNLEDSTASNYYEITEVGKYQITVATQETARYKSVFASAVLTIYPGGLEPVFPRVTEVTDSKITFVTNGYQDPENPSGPPQQRYQQYLMSTSNKYPSEALWSTAPVYGMGETVTIDGLIADTQYYLILRTVGDQNNTSMHGIWAWKTSPIYSISTGDTIRKTITLSSVAAQEGVYAGFNNLSGDTPGFRVTKQPPESILAGGTAAIEIEMGPFDTATPEGAPHKAILELRIPNPNAVPGNPYTQYLCLDQVTIQLTVVDKKAVTLTGAKDVSKVYNGKNQPHGLALAAKDKAGKTVPVTLNTEYAPLAENQTLDTVTGWTTEAPKDAGRYAVKVSTAETNDHAAAEAVFSYTITPKPITVTFGAISRGYRVTGGSNPAADTGIDLNSLSKLNGVLTGDTVSIDVSASTFVDGNVGTNKPITLAPYTLDGTDAGNYVLPAAPVPKGTITKGMQAHTEPAVTGITQSEIHYNAVSGQKYLVTSSPAKPGAAQWNAVQAAQSSVAETLPISNWKAGTKYYVHTCLAAADPANYEDAWSFTPVSLYEIQMTADGSVANPASLKIPLKNWNADEATNVGYAIGGIIDTSAVQLSVSGIPATGKLAKNGQITLTVTPKSGSTPKATPYNLQMVLVGDVGNETGKVLERTFINATVLGKIPVTVSGIADADVTKVYNGKPQPHGLRLMPSVPMGKFTAADIVTEYDLDMGAGESWSTQAPTDAGTYDVRVGVVSSKAGAFEISSAATFTYTIARKPLTVTFQKISREYDGSADIVPVPKLGGLIGTDAKEITLDVSGSYFMNSEGNAPDGSVGPVKPICLDPYTLVSTGSANVGNYELPAMPSVTGAVTKPKNAAVYGVMLEDIDTTEKSIAFDAPVDGQKYLLTTTPAKPSAVLWSNVSPRSSGERIELQGLTAGTQYYLHILAEETQNAPSAWGFTAVWTDFVYTASVDTDVPAQSITLKNWSGFNATGITVDKAGSSPDPDVFTVSPNMFGSLAKNATAKINVTAARRATATTTPLAVTLELRGTVDDGTGPASVLLDRITVQLTVKEKTPVTITGAKDVSKVYNGKKQPHGVKLAAKAASGTFKPADLAVEYADLAVLDQPGKTWDDLRWTTETPSEAGKYAVRAYVPDTDATFTSEKVTFNYTITPKPLTLSGITVDARGFEAGNSAAPLNTSKMKLGGMLKEHSGITVGGAITGSYVDDAVGTGKAVTLDPVTLTGVYAQNYSVTLPTNLKGNITKAADPAFIPLQETAVTNSATSVTFPTETRQYYTVTSAPKPPATTAAVLQKQWIRGVGGSITVSGLKPGVKRYIHVYRPAEVGASYADGVQSLYVETYAMDLAKALPGNALAFIGAENSTLTAPQKQVITIKNLGTGKLTGLTARFIGADVDKFSITAGFTAAVLSKGVATNGTAAITIAAKPQVPARPQPYEGKLVITCDQTGLSGMGAFEIPISYTVTEKIPVTVTIKEPKAKTYDGTNRAPALGQSAKAAFGSFAAKELEILYKVKDADDSAYTTAVPRDAGIYEVMARVPLTNGAYQGESQVVEYEIMKKTMKIVSVKAVPRRYEQGNTSVEVYGAAINGIIARDLGKFMLYEPTYGQYADDAIGNGKPISFAGDEYELVPVGSYTSYLNYVLVQPVVKGNITK